MAEASSDKKPDLVDQAKEIVNSSDKKPKNGLSRFIVVAVAVLLVAAIAATVVYMATGVSRKDFENAQESAQKLSRTYSSISGTVIDLDVSEERAAQRVEDLKEDKRAYHEAFDELAEQKAIQRDDDAKEKFEAVKAKNDKLNEYFDTTIELYEKVAPMVYELSEVSITVEPDEVVGILRDMDEQLNEIDVKQKLNVEYIDELKSIVPDFIAALEAYIDGDGSAVFRVQTLSNQLSTVDRNLQIALRTLVGELDASREINTLLRYLTNRANGN